MSSQNLGTRPPEWRSLAMCYAAAAVSDRGLRWCRLAEGFSTQVTLKHSLFILYLEYATAGVVPVGGRVFQTEDKRVLFRDKQRCRRCWT